MNDVFIIFDLLSMKNFLFSFFFLAQSILCFSQSKPAYCSKIVLQDSLEISLFSPDMFRFRKSHLQGERFPAKYEIPFVIGKTTPWAAVKFTHREDKNYYYIQTDSVQIRLAKRGLDWTIWNLKKQQIYPSNGPVYGMFKDGYTVFDNVSAFNQPSKINRFSHWFYSHDTGRYTDVYQEEDLIEDTYFIHGPDYPRLFAQLNELIGPEPLLPKKAYGFLQTQHLSCQGNQEQLMEVARQFRAKKIPLDYLILDFEWGDACDGDQEITWGGSLDWSKNYTSPLSPAEMIQELKKMNIDLMLIHHSAGDFKNRKHQGWTESLYDEKTWWDKYQQKLEMGIRGTWQDTRINDITDSYIYRRTQDFYGENQRVLFLGCRKVMSLNPWDFRFSTMPTENLIGARRYPFHWTEDCSFSWNEMAFQLKAINNTYGPMSGYSYLTSDVIGSNWKIQARWQQFTALSALARSHNSKPWSGNVDLFDFTNKIRITGRDSVQIKKQSETLQTETAEASIRKYLQLRYQLLPYLYSYALHNYQTGFPITRPLLLAFPQDYICSSDTWPHQFMLGDYLLIAPVYGDFQSMEIYLPKGHDWIDFESKEEFKDGGIITYNTQDINKLPIFIKKGAIIPQGQAREWIDSAEPDSLKLEIFPARFRSSFTLLEDDGESMQYQKGAYATTRIECQQGEGIEISIDATQGNYRNKPKERPYCLWIHQITQKPQEVQAEQAQQLKWTYDERHQRLEVQFIKSTDLKTRINIKP